MSEDPLDPSEKTYNIVGGRDLVEQGDLIGSGTCAIRAVAMITVTDQILVKHVHFR
jgi:hypothetical protein